jgi:mannitol-1-phosphate 5-dehydrogenase
VFLARGSKTFVGFGFGPIQSGLLLFEAYASGNFSRFVVSEVDRATVSALARSGGRCRVNVAGKQTVENRELEGIEVYDPLDPTGREALAKAVAESDEMATALPSVAFYDGGPEAPARIIADGLTCRRRVMPTIVYAAENHNKAAEILRGAVARHAPAGKLEGFETLNTVIGKMSGVITEPEVIAGLRLKTLTDDVPCAVLVEEFNRILVSRIGLSGYKRGIEVFAEKDDLLPFEEAKLYGHNAIHALIAYLADLRGIETIARAGRDAGIMRIARAAFIDESGGALVRRRGTLGDALFTPEGYRQYAEDLLDRMTRPTLNDTVARVGRDHMRKLGYDDRLFGTMRLALEHGIEPVNLALGAAAGLCSLIKRREEYADLPAAFPEDPDALTRDTLAEALVAIWRSQTDRFATQVIDLTWDALAVLKSQ